MTDFLKKHAKLIFMIYGILIALVILAALFYMTNVSNVHIAYSRDENQQIYFTKQSKITVNDFENTSLFRYFERANDPKSPFVASEFATNTDKYIEVNPNATDNILRYGLKETGKSFADTIFDFQTSMSSFNTLIVVLGLISLVAYAIILIFSNQSRRVYYKSNLLVGVTMPLLVIVLSVVLLINNLSLLGTFNKNIDLFRIVSYTMDENIALIRRNGAGSDYSRILNETTHFGSIGYTLLTVALLIVIIYSICLIAYTVFRYKSSTKDRNDIIERAANNND